MRTTEDALCCLSSVCTAVRIVEAVLYHFGRVGGRSRRSAVGTPPPAPTKRRKCNTSTDSSLCMFFRESFVDLDRRRYTREEIRVQALGENVDVGQICETKSEILVRVVAHIQVWPCLETHPHHSDAGWVRSLMGDDD